MIRCNFHIFVELDLWPVWPNHLETLTQADFCLSSSLHYSSNRHLWFETTLALHTADAHSTSHSSFMSRLLSPCLPHLHPPQSQSLCQIHCISPLYCILSSNWPPSVSTAVFGPTQTMFAGRMVSPVMLCTHGTINNF